MITPSDDHGSQAFVIAEAVRLSLASSLTIPASLSTNGSNDYIIQIGDSGGIENTGYVSESSDRGGDVTSTEGFILTRTSTSTSACYGIATICNFSSNSWISSANISITGIVSSSAGSKSLNATLDRIRITTVGSSDTFDAGSVNIMYE